MSGYQCTALYLGAGKRSSFPVDTDKREQFVLDCVPFTGTGRKVADGDFKAGFVGESLEVFLPELQPVPVRSSRVRRNHQSRRFCIAFFAEMLPPAADGGYREFARVRIDPDVDVSLIVPDVIDAVWRRFAELLIRKVVHVDLYWLSFGKPQPPVSLVVANELFLLGINRDNGVARFKELRRSLADMLKLCLPVRVIGSFLGFLVTLQTVIGGIEEVQDLRMADDGVLFFQLLFQGVQALVRPLEQ